MVWRDRIATFRRCPSISFSRVQCFYSTLSMAYGVIYVLLVSIICSTRINRAPELHPHIQIPGKATSPLSFAQRNLTHHQLPLSSRDIIKECNIISKDSHVKRFPGRVAAVFPNDKENSKIALSYHEKLDIVFPRVFSVTCAFFWFGFIYYFWTVTSFRTVFVFTG